MSRPGSRSRANRLAIRQGQLTSAGGVALTLASTRRSRRLSVVLALYLFVVGWSIASAHANLVGSVPPAEAVLAAPPAELTLQFDSALAEKGNSVTLYRSDRSAIGLDAPSLTEGAQPKLKVNLPALTPDVYTVGWTSVSGEDGHSLNSFYSFTVGQVHAALAAPNPLQLSTGDLQVTLRPSRAAVGPMVFDFAVRDSKGQPLKNLQRVIVRYSPIGLSLGQNEVIAPASGSDARTPAFTLGLVGDWQCQIIVRRSDADDVTSTIQLTLPPAATATPVTAPTPSSPAAAPSPPAVAVATTPPAPSTTAESSKPTPGPQVAVALPTTVGSGVSPNGATPAPMAGQVSSGGPSLPLVGGLVGLVALVVVGSVAMLRRR